MWTCRLPDRYCVSGINARSGYPALASIVSELTKNEMGRKTTAVLTSLAWQVFLANSWHTQFLKFQEDHDERNCVLDKIHDNSYSYLPLTLYVVMNSVSHVFTQIPLKLFIYPLVCAAASSFRNQNAAHVEF